MNSRLQPLKAGHWFGIEVTDFVCSLIIIDENIRFGTHPIGARATKRVIKMRNSSPIGMYIPQAQRQAVIMYVCTQLFFLSSTSGLENVWYFT